MSIPTVNFIHASGDTLIVGSESNGLYRSTDIGRTWTTFNAGLPPFPNVRALLQTPRGLLLGLEQEGLYTSTDRRTWKATDSSLADIQVLTYCLIDSIVHAGLSNGALLTSTDRGNNWLRTPTPWSGRITSLAAQGPNLFASVWDEGIYLSTDGGRSWPVQNPALSSSRIHSLVAVDSDVAGARVFAGTEEASYMSSDGGTTWYESSLPVHRITGTARSQLGLFAGAHEGKIFRSVDRGSTWSQICTAEHKIRAITATRNTIASCGDGGFYALNQFTLRGQRWEGGAEVPWSAGRAVGFSSIGMYYGGVAGFWYSSFHDTSAASWLKWSIVLPFARTTVSAFISLDSVLLIGTNGGILRCNLDRLIVGVEEPHPVSDTPTILELYPHPVHERASVAFQLEHDTPVELFLLDQAGRHISLLSSSMYPRGRHVVPLDAEFLARGLYICILSTPTHQFTRLFVLR
ncbi:MAG: hypothetical protein HY962_12505 [Ignavibacteriae bacterium]|nr:hypothetical protein [Ignavibacteriota bacterium]